MARPVILVALLIPMLAFALGPKDPFAPPRRSGDAPASDTHTVQRPATLSGVRLGHTPAALIDGEWITLGHSARGARLVSLRAHDAVLQHADGRIERVALFPPPAAASAPTPDPLVVKKDLP